MIPHYMCRCSCGKEEYMAWHPFWGDHNICYSCRDKMVEKHKAWMDKLLEKSHKKCKENCETICK
jgi:hypothetical protein